MQAQRKKFAYGAALLLAALCITAPLHATPPPAGTITALDNVGLFDGSGNLLNSCVALQNADGTPQLDANGNPRRFDVVLSLNRATLTFKLLSNVPFNANTGLDCSGAYRNGVYTDAVLITNLSPYYNGSVWNLTLDYVQGSNLEFKLRVDSSFGTLRTFAGNSTQLGSDLGDFAQTAVREYGLTNIAPTIVIKLPQCSDPQGDQNRVMIVKNGTTFAGATPGANFGWSTSGLTVGDYQFQTYCSDQMAMQTLAQTNGLTYSSAYAANSANAPGTLTIRIVAGTPTPTPTTGTLTFNFSATTSTADQNLIREAAEFARDFLTTTFGRTLQQNSTLSTSTTAQGCTQGGSSAFTGSRSMTLCVGNQGWTVHGAVTKRKIVIHEVFHLLQFELGWIGGPPGSITGPHWLIEGSAEYVGWLGVASLGHVTMDTARGCMLKEVADFAVQQPPGLPNLDQLETAQSFSRPGPVYPLAMVGANQLIVGSSASALLTFGAAVSGGTPWATAFASAFGTTSTAFYAQFPTYKAGLSVPADYLCRI